MDAPTTIATPTQAAQQQPTPSTCLHALSTTGESLPAHWLDDLFGRLRAIFGPRLADTLGVRDGDDDGLAEVRRQWGEALGGMTRDEVRAGLVAARTRRFPPSLGEFLHLCRPALDPEAAWHEAVDGLAAHARGERFAWSHPGVYWAARPFGHELASGTFDRCRKRWEAALSRQWQARTWDAPPDPTVRALSAPEPPRRADPAKVRQLFAQAQDRGRAPTRGELVARFRSRLAAGQALSGAQLQWLRDVEALHPASAGHADQVCTRCGQTGHRASTCPWPAGTEADAMEHAA